jgi:hypothetical protein
MRMQECLELWGGSSVADRRSAPWRLVAVSSAWGDEAPAGAAKCDISRVRADSYITDLRTPAVSTTPLDVGRQADVALLRYAATAVGTAAGANRHTPRQEDP